MEILDRLNIRPVPPPPSPIHFQPILPPLPPPKLQEEQSSSPSHALTDVESRSPENYEESPLSSIRSPSESSEAASLNSEVATALESFYSERAETDVEEIESMSPRTLMARRERYMDYSSDDEDWVKESLRRVSNARRKKKFRSIMKSRSDVESGNEEPSDERKSLEDEELFTLQPEHSKPQSPWSSEIEGRLVDVSDEESVKSERSTSEKLKKLAKEETKTESVQSEESLAERTLESVGDEKNVTHETTDESEEAVSQEGESKSEDILESERHIASGLSEKSETVSESSDTPQKKSWSGFLEKSHLSGLESEDTDEELISQLPVYYPALHGSRSVDEYEITKYIASGTHGRVYRAIEKRTDKTVVLKHIKLHEREGVNIIFLREIKLMTLASKHKNIINFKEVVIGKGWNDIYLVMEFLPYSLNMLIDTMYIENEFLAIGQIKGLMFQLLSAVSFLHNEWIIHRDLKPANILLTENGVLKVADFGLARMYGDPPAPYTPVVVTLYYRSPELLVGTKLYSTEIDIWSCGCIFAELLLFKPLFYSVNELGVLDMIFRTLGTPCESAWSDYEVLKVSRDSLQRKYPKCTLERRLSRTVIDEDESKSKQIQKGSKPNVCKDFVQTCGSSCAYFLTVLMVILALSSMTAEVAERFRYDRQKRVTATDALEHQWFLVKPSNLPYVDVPYVWTQGGSQVAEQIEEKEKVCSKLGVRSTAGDFTLQESVVPRKMRHTWRSLSGQSD